jgi:hypothetical protein
LDAILDAIMNAIMDAILDIILDAIFKQHLSYTWICLRYLFCYFLYQIEHEHGKHVDISLGVMFHSLKLGGRDTKTSMPVFTLFISRQFPFCIAQSICKRRQWYAMFMVWADKSLSYRKQVHTFWWNRSQNLDYKLLLTLLKLTF